jgi:carbon-monoxide dehydrogenase medium subunit
LKPARFSYHTPRAAEEVDDLLHELGSDAKVLAGGQSLVPILNMRLASPSHLVDINRLENAAHEPASDGDDLVFGPLVRQAVAEGSKTVAATLPVLRATLRFVAHPAIRSRGTVAGSIAHADPAAELPSLLVALEGSAVARGRRGRRTIPAEQLFRGPFEPSLEPGEWLEAVRFPRRPGAGFAVDEVARRHGDYALCGVIAVAGHEADGSLRVGLTYFGVGEAPVRVFLSAVDPDRPDELAGAVNDAVAAALDPQDDLHAGRELRLRLAERLGIRAARRAAVAAVTG